MTARAVTEWQAVAGGVRADGSVVAMPAALERARALDSWCQRYGTLPWPGSLMDQPAIPFLRWQNILAAATPRTAREEGSLEQGFSDLPMVAL